MSYLLIKSIHLIFLIAWMVSLLYLPRLFVYHSNLAKSSSSYNLFLLMEIRLIKIISIPATVLTLVTGSILIYYQDQLIYENYFKLKLLFVFFLILYQVYLFFIYVSFKEKNNHKSQNYFKLINEIPTIFMIIIILLVVLKPNIG